MTTVRDRLHITCALLLGAVLFVAAVWCTPAGAVSMPSNCRGWSYMRGGTLHGFAALRYCHR